MVQQLLLVILIFDVLLAHYPPFGSCLLNTQCHTFECVRGYVHSITIGLGTRI